MPSAWGKSWGNSWGNSWGTITPGTVPVWPFIPLPPECLGLDIRGTLRVDSGLPGATPIKVVFQRTSGAAAQYRTGTGAPMMIRAHVIPADPKTPAQIARREKMAAAVAAWHALTDEQKSAYKPHASRRRITAFNSFISEFLLA